jgi:hypothetical protein
MHAAQRHDALRLHSYIPFRRKMSKRAADQQYDYEYNRRGVNTLVMMAFGVSDAIKEEAEAKMVVADTKVKAFKAEVVVAEAKMVVADKKVEAFKAEMVVADKKITAFKAEMVLEQAKVAKLTVDLEAAEFTTEAVKYESRMGKLAHAEDFKNVSLQLKMASAKLTAGKDVLSKHCHNDVCRLAVTIYCADCKFAYYCSKACQHAHYQASHASACTKEHVVVVKEEH